MIVFRWGIKSDPYKNCVAIVPNAESGFELFSLLLSSLDVDNLVVSDLHGRLLSQDLNQIYRDMLDAFVHTHKY
jgi:hypothetical protein